MKRRGVRLVVQGHVDHPTYVLSAHSVAVGRGCWAVVDFAGLQERARAEAWEGRLRAALSDLGLTPTQDDPGWILAPYTNFR